MITSSLVTYKTKKEDLKAIVDCMISGGFDKIYIVDNSPTDALRHFALSLTDKVEYIYGHGNIGYGGAHNIAIRRSAELGATYHLVSNIDIFFEGGVIDKISSFMDAHDDVGVVIPKTYYPDGRIQMVSFLYPTPFDMIGRRLLPKFMYRKRCYKYELHPGGYDQTRVVPIICGCFMFLRVKTVVDAGLFDENVFMYFEDNDLSRRIHAISKPVYLASTSIVHECNEEHRSSKKLLYASIKSAIYYFNKWGWLFDKERRYVNKHAFDNDNIITE